MDNINEMCLMNRLGTFCIYQILMNGKSSILYLNIRDGLSYMILIIIVNYCSGNL